MALQLAELKAAGYTVADLQAVDDDDDNITDGFTAAQLKAGGFTAAELKAGAFATLTALINAGGFTAAELKNDFTFFEFTNGNFFTAAELKAGGYTAAQLKNHFTLTELIAVEFTAAELKAGGFTAAQLKNHFTLTELLAVGFTAAELKAAGFTATELKDAGFTLAELKDAGFTATELKNDFTLAELKAGGFTVAELKNDFTVAELKATGFTLAELKAGGVTATELIAVEFTLAELKAVGFTAAELKTEGFTAAELKAGGFTAAELKTAGFTLIELLVGGFTTAELRVGGFTIADIMMMSPEAISDNLQGSGGHTAIIDVANSYISNFDNSDHQQFNEGLGIRIFMLTSNPYWSLITNSRMTLKLYKLKSDGTWEYLYTQNITDPGIGIVEEMYSEQAHIRLIDYNWLRNWSSVYSSNGEQVLDKYNQDRTNFPPLKFTIKFEHADLPEVKWDIGYFYPDVNPNTRNQSAGRFSSPTTYVTLPELKEGGYTARELLTYWPDYPDLHNIYTPSELYDQTPPFTVQELHDVGYTARQTLSLENNPYNYTDLHDIYTPTELYDNESPPFTVSEMKLVGYTAREVITSTHDYPDLLNEYTPIELYDNESPQFTVQEMKNVGYLARQVMITTYLNTDLLNVYTPAELYDNELTLKENSYELKLLLPSVNHELINNISRINVADGKYILNWKSNNTFYNSGTKYGMTNGTYIFQYVPEQHPIAIINTNNNITYTGDDNKKFIVTIGGQDYNFYYGDVTVTVTGDFDKASLYCYYHGYMGGDELIQYVNNIYETQRFTVQEMKDVGYKARETITSTYDYSDLLNEYTPIELYDNESPQFTVQEMKNVGYTARQVMTITYNYPDLLNVYTPTELYNNELKLKDGSYEIFMNGDNNNESNPFTVQEMKLIGYAGGEVVTSRYDYPDLKNIYSPVELYDEQLTVQEMRNVGYLARQVMTTTYNYPDLHNVYSSSSLQGEKELDPQGANGYEVLDTYKPFTLHEYKISNLSAREVLATSDFNPLKILVENIWKLSHPQSTLLPNQTTILNNQVYLASSNNANSTAGKAFDTSIDSDGIWTSNTTPSSTTIDNNTVTGHWLQVDMIQKVSITKFNINYSNRNDDIKSAIIASSIDSNTWTEIYSISNELRQNNNKEYIIENDIFNYSNIPLARYYRIIVTSVHDANTETASISEWSLYGFTEEQLPTHTNVYYFSNIFNLYTPDELSNDTPPFTLQEMKDIGYEARQMLTSGYTYSDLKDVYTANDLYNNTKALDPQGVGGYEILDTIEPFTPHELELTGYTARQILDIEITDGGNKAYQMSDLRGTNTETTVVGENLALTTSEVNYDDLYTSAELKVEGFTASELKPAGYTPSELKDGGYTARQLLLPFNSITENMYYIMLNFKESEDVSGKNSVFQEPLEDQQYKDNITSSSGPSISGYDNFYALGEDKFGGNGWRGHMPFSRYDLSSPSSTLHQDKSTTEHRALCSASSEHNSSQAAYEVFDGSTSSSNRWASTIHTQSDYTTTLSDNTVLTGNWIQIDIGETVIVKNFTVYSNYNYTRPKKAEVLTSITGQDGSWVSIYSINYDTDYGSDNNSTSVSYEIEETNWIEGRYYRMAIMESMDDAYVGLTEWELYGNILSIPTTINASPYNDPWLQIDMGQNVAVTHFDLEYSDNYLLKNALILTKLNIEDEWNIIYEISNPFNGEGDIINNTKRYNITFDNQSPSRYYRIVITDTYDLFSQTSGNHFVQINKWVLFGFQVENEQLVNDQIAAHLITKTHDYPELYNVYSPQELYDQTPPFTISEMKLVGYKARQILTTEYTYPDLFRIFTYNQLYQDEKGLVDGSYELLDTFKPFTPHELELIGYKARQILDVEITNGGAKAYQISDLRGTHSESTPAGENLALVASEVNYNDLITTTELKSETSQTFASTELKAGGYTAGECKDAGYTARELLINNAYAYTEFHNVYTSQELYDETPRFASTELKAGGYTASECKEGGYTARELLINNAYAYTEFNNVYTPQELYDETPRFTVQEMKDVGYLARQILTTPYEYPDLNNIYSTTELYNEIPRFTVQELYDIGCLARNVLITTYDYPDLRDVYSPSDLYDETPRFTVQEMKDVGYLARQILTSTHDYPDLHIVFSSNDMLLNEYKIILSNHSLYNQNKPYLIHDDVSHPFTPAELKAVGYTASDCKAGGYTARQLLRPFISQTETPYDLSTFDYPDLRDVYSPQELYDQKSPANPSVFQRFTSAELRSVGYLARQILTLDVLSYPDILTAGYTGNELYQNEKKLVDGSYEVTNINKPFTPHEFKLTGHTPREVLSNTSYQVIDLRGTKDGATAVGENLALTSSEVNYNDLYTTTELKSETSQTFTSTELKAGGYTASECKEGGYTARELLINNAYAYTEFHNVYTSQELYDETPRFTPTELKSTGFTAREILLLPYSYSDLYSIYNLNELNIESFTPQEFKLTGHTPREVLSNTSYQVIDLRGTKDGATAVGENLALTSSEVNYNDLYTTTELKSETSQTFTPTELKAGGYTASECKEGGYTARELLINNAYAYTEFHIVYTSQELYDETPRFTVQEMKDIGYLARQILLLPYSYSDLHNIYSSIELYRNEKKLVDGSYEISNISQPFTPHELELTGYTARQILDIEITDGGNKAYQMSDLRGTNTETTVVGENLALTSSEVKYDDLITISELKAEGFTISELKAGGYTASECKEGGYTARELLINNAYAYTEFHNQFTPTELYDEIPRFTVQEMKDIGYLARQVLTSTYEYTDLHNIYSSIELYNNELKVNDNNYALYLSPNGNTIKNPFTIPELKAVGYLARQVLNIISDSWIIGTFNKPYEYSDLKAGGYTENDLYQNEKTLNPDSTYEVLEEDKPFTPYELKITGYTARQILGIEAIDSTNPYAVNDLRGTLALLDGTTNAGINNDLIANQVNYNDLFTVTELRVETFTSAELKAGGYTVSELNIGGYTVRELLIDDAYTLTEFKNVYSPTELYNETPPFTVQEMKDVGYFARQIITSEYIYPNLKTVFTINELYEDEKKLDQNGTYELADPLVSDRFTVDELRQVGFNSYEVLSEIGDHQHISDLANDTDDYNYDDLVLGGYTATELKTQIDPNHETNNSDFDYQTYTAKTLREKGNYTVTQLSMAGYNANEMKHAGFTALELYNNGYNASELYLGGTGFSAREMKRGGFSCLDLTEGGYPLAGNSLDIYKTYPYYNSRELKEAGYTLRTSLKDLPNNLINIAKFAGKDDGLKETLGGTEGTYINIPTTTDGTGSGLELEIIVDIDGIVTSAIVTKEGIGYGINDKVIVQDSIIGATANLEFDLFKSLKQFPIDESASFVNLTLHMFTVLQLRNLDTGRYTLNEIKDGTPSLYNATELKIGNYDQHQLKTAGYTAKELYYGFNYTDENLRDATQRDINAFIPIDIQSAGYSNEVLLAVGFPDNELASILTLQELKDAGFTSDQARALYADENGDILLDPDGNQYKTIASEGLTFIVNNLLNVGYTEDKIKLSGYTSSEFKIATNSNTGSLFSVADLLDVTIFPSGAFSPSQIKDAGYPALDFKGLQNPDTAITRSDKTYKPTEILNITNSGPDYTLDNLYPTSNILPVSDNQGYTAEEMKADPLGYTAADLHSGSIALPTRWSIYNLFNAGYTNQELYDISPTPNIGILKGFGYTVSELQTIKKNDNNDAYQLYEYVAVGYTLRELKESGGYILPQLQSQMDPDTGSNFTIEDLYADDDGILFTFYNLKINGGYTAGDFQTATFKEKNERTENITPRELQALGFTLQELKNYAGFTEPSHIAVLQSLENDIIHSVIRTDTITGEIDTNIDSNNDIAVVDGIYKGEAADVDGNGVILKALNNGIEVDTDIKLKITVDEETVTSIIVIDGGSQQWEKDQEFIARIPKNNGTNFDLTIKLNEDENLRNDAFPASILRTEYTSFELQAANFTAETLRLAGYTPLEMKLILPIFDFKDTGFTFQQLLYDIVQYPTLVTTYREQLVSDKEFNDGINPSYSKSAEIYLRFFKGLKSSGFKASNFKSFNNPDTSAPFPIEKLKQIGFGVADLRLAGYTKYEIYDGDNRNAYTDNSDAIASVPFNAIEMANAEYTILDLGKTNIVDGINIGGVGFKVYELRESGFTALQMRNAGYNLEELKLGDSDEDSNTYGQGGYVANELKNAGYTALQLKDVGFTAVQMRNVTPPFNIRELSAAGFTAEELTSVLQAEELKVYGYTVEDLISSNFSAYQIKLAGYTLREMIEAGFDFDVMKNTLTSDIPDIDGNFSTIPGFTVNEFQQEGYGPGILNIAGFTASECKKVGYNANQLKLGDLDITNQVLNYSQYEIVDATDGTYNDVSPSVNSGSGTGMKLQIIINGGKVSSVIMLNIGEGVLVNGIFKTSYEIGNILTVAKNDIGASVNLTIQLNNLKEDTRYNLTQIVNAGYDISQLKFAGYKAIDDLSGFDLTVREFRNGGYTADELLGYDHDNDVNTQAVGYSITEIRNGGYRADELIGKTGLIPSGATEGIPFDAQLLRLGGYSATELKIAGYTGTDLNTMTNKYNVTELMIAGYSPNEIRQGGYSGRELLTGGFIYSDLKDGNYLINDLRNINKNNPIFTATELKVSGYTANEIVSSTNIVVNNATAEELYQAGFTAIELKTVLYTASNLNHSGYTASECRDAGYTAAQIKDAGYTVQEMEDALFTALELKSAGFNINDLRAAGYDATQMKSAGFTAAQLKTAGYTATELSIHITPASESGDIPVPTFSASELNTAGYTIREIKSAGYTPQEIYNSGFINIEDLKAGGYTVNDLRTITPSYSITDYIDSGYYTISDLRLAGYTGTQVVDEPSVGFTLFDLKANGYTAAQLKTEDNLSGIFSLRNLIDEGYSRNELLEADYTSTQLSEEGLLNTVSQLAQRIEDLKAERLAGKTITQMRAIDTSYTPKEFQLAGYTSYDFEREQITFTRTITISSVTLGTGLPTIEGNNNEMIVETNQHGNPLSALAVDPVNGNINFIDLEQPQNSRVNYLKDSNGNPIILDKPAGIVKSTTGHSAGDYFITEQGTNSIIRFSPDGTIYESYFVGNPEPTRDISTGEIEYDGNGKIAGYDSIPRGNINGVNTIRQEVGGGFNPEISNFNTLIDTPGKMWLDDNGNILFEDTGNGVIKKIEINQYEADGITQITETYGENEVYYVSNTEKHTISRFYNNRLTEWFGKTGISGTIDGNDETARFNNPGELLLELEDDHDVLYLIDMGNVGLNNGSLRKIDTRSGGLCATLVTGMKNPKGFLKVGNDFYICDQGNDRIIHYNIDGTKNMNWIVLPSNSKPKDIIQRKETHTVTSTQPSSTSRTFTMYYVTCGDHTIRKIYFEDDGTTKIYPSALANNYDIISGTIEADEKVDGADYYLDNDLLTVKTINSKYKNPSRLLFDTRGEDLTATDIGKLLIVCDDSVRQLEIAENDEMAGKALSDTKLGMHFAAVTGSTTNTRGQIRKYIFDAEPPNVALRLKDPTKQLGQQYIPDFDNPKKIILHGTGPTAELYVIHNDGFSKIDMEGFVTDLWTDYSNAIGSKNKLNNPNGFLLEKDESDNIIGVLIADTDNNRIARLKVENGVWKEDGVTPQSAPDNGTTVTTTTTTYGDGALITITFPATGSPNKLLIGGSGYGADTTLTLDTTHSSYTDLGMRCTISLTIDIDGTITDVSFTDYTPPSSSSAQIEVTFPSEGSPTVNIFDGGSGYPSNATLTLANNTNAFGENFSMNLVIDNGVITGINFNNYIAPGEQDILTTLENGGLILSDNGTLSETLNLTSGLILTDPGITTTTTTTIDGEPVQSTDPDPWNVNTDSAWLYNVEEPTDIIIDAVGNYYITSKSKHTLTKIYSNTTSSTSVQEVVCGKYEVSGNINDPNTIYQVQDFQGVNDNDVEVDYLRLKHTIKSRFDGPSSLIIDPNTSAEAGGLNNILIIDQNNDTLKKLSISKEHFDTKGCFYVTDTETKTITKIDYHCNTSDINGNTPNSKNGDTRYFNIPLPVAGFTERGNNVFGDPKGLCLYDINGDSHILVVDSSNNKVWKIDKSDNTVDVFSDGVSAKYDGAVGETANDTGFNNPTDITNYISLDSYGAIDNCFLVSDTSNQVIKKLSGDGLNCEVFVGRHGYSGHFDSGAGFKRWAQFRNPEGLYYNFDTNFVYIVDTGNNCLRKVEVGNDFAVLTEAGGVSQSGNFSDGINLNAKFNNPNNIVFVNDDIYISDSSSDLIRKGSIQDVGNDYNPEVPMQSIFAPISATNEINGGENIYFGNAISANDSYLLISSKDSFTTDLTDGDKYVGKVYIYESNQQKQWTYSTELSPPDEINQDDGTVKDKSNVRFGEVLYIHKSTAFISCKNYDNGTGIVYVYKPGQTGWNLVQKLQGSVKQPNYLFGHSISAYQNEETDIGNLLIGSPKAEGSDLPGEVYHYKLNDPAGSFGYWGVGSVDQNNVTIWTQSNILFPDDSEINDQFGCSIEIGDSMAVIGSKHKNKNNQYKTGCVYVYTKNNLSDWLEMKPTPVSIEATEGDEYGVTVAINKELSKNLDGNQRIFVGAWKKDSPDDSGRVYVYNLEAASDASQTVSYNQRTMEWEIQNLPAPPEFSTDAVQATIGKYLVYDGNEWTTSDDNWQIASKAVTTTTYKFQPIFSNNQADNVWQASTNINNV